eukprot:PhF_6_TR42810/c0_g1_i1/m.64813
MPVIFPFQMMFVVFVVLLACVPFSESQYMALMSNQDASTWLLDEKTTFPTAPSTITCFVRRVSDGGTIPLVYVKPPLPLVNKSKKVKPLGASPRRKRKTNWTKTRTLPKKKRNVTRTVPFPTISRLEWNVTTLTGTLLTTDQVTGTRSIVGTSSNTFTIGRIVVNDPGRYNFRATAVIGGFGGPPLVMNIVLIVRPLPRSASTTNTNLRAFNGTIMSPPPTFFIFDGTGTLAWSSTTRFELRIIQTTNDRGILYSSVITGVAEGGVLIFTNFRISDPGEYTVRLTATLVDGTTFQSNSDIQISVSQAVPKELRSLTNPNGNAWFIFPTFPVFAMYDEVGPSADIGAKIRIVITQDNPSIFYTTRQNNPTLILGTTSVPVTHHAFLFSNFSMDTPGQHTITATVTTSQNATLSVSVAVSCSPIPTFTIVGSNVLEVNRPARFVLSGSLSVPNSSASLKLSKDENCSPGFDNSLTIPWPSAGIAILIPSDAAEKAFLCLQIRPTRTLEWYSMMREYRQRFTENTPVSKQFSVAPTGECTPLTVIESARYVRNGWRTAEPTRRYGCHLQPPVGGTIAPCGCPVYLQCEEFRHGSFTPSGLDIGRCVCCAPWVLITAWVLGAMFVAVNVAVVIKFF